MPRKTRELVKRLVTKFGLSEVKKRGRDHKWYGLTLPGIPPVFTKVSHGHREIDVSLETKIARELRVGISFYNEMMECTKSKKAYYEFLEDSSRPQ